MITAGLVLAAGLSSRMGAFKPLLQIDGKPLLQWSIDSILASGAQSVVVVLGHRAQEVQDTIAPRYASGQIRFTCNAAYQTTDMLTSIQTGLPVLPPCDAFWLLPGDMPAVGSCTFASLRDIMQATDATVVFPTVEGRRKHPPLISSRCIADIMDYRGEGGLRGLWQTYADEVAEVAVADQGCLMDADTMEDFTQLANYLHRKEAMAHTNLQEL